MERVVNGDPIMAGTHWIVETYHSVIGKKYVMALTGFIAVGYVFFHMLGNLQVYAGPEKLNAYAAFLKSNLVLLWIVRIFLLAAILAHIITGCQLAWRSYKARPVKYTFWRPIKSTFSSRTMRWTGPVIALFIIFHILHLTTGTLHPNFQERNVFANVVSGFQHWYISLFYVFAMVFLCIHMLHGVWSMFESVGINHPEYNRFIRGLATVITVVVALGFISIPVAILTGAVA